MPFYVALWHCIHLKSSAQNHHKRNFVLGSCFDLLHLLNFNTTNISFVLSYYIIIVIFGRFGCWSGLFLGIFCMFYFCLPWKTLYNLQNIASSFITWTAWNSILNFCFVTICAEFYMSPKLSHKSKNDDMLLFFLVFARVFGVRARLIWQYSWLIASF